VVIIGTNLSGTTAVSFGGTAAQSFVVNSSSQITTVVGSGSTGVISVTTPFGTATSASSFTYTGAPGIATFGLDSGNSVWNEQASTMDAMRFQNTAGTGTLTKLEILFDTSTHSGSVRLGIYADSSGRPGSLLLDAGEVTVSSGWVSIGGLSLAVTANTYYWLVFNLQNNNGVMYQSGQPANSHCWSPNTYGALPANFPGFNYNNNQYVMRATVTTS
jgi:hypothetical protein